MYYMSQQKQQEVVNNNLYFYHIDFFSLFSLSSLLFLSFSFLLFPFFLFLFYNPFIQIYKKMLDWKNFIVEYISVIIWIVRDKARCRPYRALLTRYLAIVYIDLLTK